MATQIPPELTPAQAAALVTSGQKVYIGCCTSYARAIANALAARSEELENVTIGCSNIIPPMTFLDCANPDAFHISTYFMGYEERRALKAGRADFTSVHLGQVDIWCHETFLPDIAFLDVSLPDENGFVSLSASGCCMHPYIIEETPTVVFQINRFSPYVTGLDTLVPLSAAQYLVRADVEKETIPGGVMEAGNSGHVPVYFGRDSGRGLFADRHRRRRQRRDLRPADKKRPGLPHGNDVRRSHGPDAGGCHQQQPA